MLLVAVIALSAVVAAATCPPFKAPSLNETKYVQRLPDPFLFQSGQKVQTKADWKCRRDELSALIQEFEYGPLPPRPGFVNGSFSNTTLTVYVEENGKRIEFSATVRLPRSEGPHPAVIAIGGSSVPIKSDIVTITFRPDDIASQAGPPSRGRGKFYDIYGSKHTAGSFIAWTWGVSRIIDVLELVGPEITSIDTQRLAITGCSRYGKGALVVGAFEPRITLTIPQEAGVGGPVAWRLFDPRPCRGICPTIPPWEEYSWFQPGFDKIARNFALLPFDQHSLIGLVAPRGLLIIENNIDMQFPEGAVVGARAGKTIYEALQSNDTMGFVSTGFHSHCSFPSIELPYLNAFYDRFLLGQQGETNVFVSSVNVNWTNWANWDVPKLS